MAGRSGSGPGPAVAGGAAAAGLAPALGELLARWAAHLAASGRAPATRTAYVADLAGFLGFLTGHLGGAPAPAALAGLTLGDFRAWLAAERARGRSGRSLSRAVSALRGFFAFLEEREGIACEAIHGVTSPKSPRPLPRPVAAADAQALLAAVDAGHPEPWIAARDAAVLALLWGAGLRISEALGLRWGDAPLGDAVTVRGKGGRSRRVPVLPAAGAWVERYRRLCPHAATPGGALFLGARGGPLHGNMVRRAMAAARAGLGLPANATPHALRHAFATELLAAGGDLRAVQELLGHARLATTQVYTGVDAARLAAVHAATHPRGGD
ncbi:tyrosine recombinase XerC [Paralimibaculum aggregatum]|uniref:Tyrosine recombinase XerC n=1 Tax=Paralimibaculum aggregatum TaxID=3036245 RepID=A0ABQ6LGN5_9RHOB|nr:tyrosine-type recombinase/integrase [Limibaculum sp. NKW23]GMG82474.1 tyrosine recombinase XerC [Limibaculum sp. NKW23]